MALADVNEEGMAETARRAERAATSDGTVSTHVLDVADRDAVAGVPGRVSAKHPGVDLLFNNAGVALAGTFEQVSPEDFEWLFEINFWGVVRMTRAFLPLLQKSDDARVVNLSSVFGLVAPEGQVPYSASKFAVRGFSEGLRHELEGSSVGVTVVHPGGVDTAIADSAKVADGLSEEEREERLKEAKELLTLPPEEAGEIIVRAVERRKRRVLVGKDAAVISLLARLAPVRYWKLMELLFGR